MLPCIAGHVGADTAGVILAEAPHLADEVSLVVDVGTNAEIVLGNRERLLAASSPTGPAFEGAQISCGQRAAPGAIERVRIDPETLEPRVKVDRLRRLVGRAGLRGTSRSPACAARGSSRSSPSSTSPGSSRPTARSTGRSPRGRRGSSPTGGRSPTSSGRASRSSSITQNDVRQIQLAKAALHAGCRLLMERYGIERVDRDPARGSLRRAHRPRSRPRARARPRLRPGRRHLGGQRGRHRRAHRPPEPRRARGDRARRPPRREDRDGGRAALPGALRPRDGDPARDRPVRAAGAERAAPAANERPPDAAAATSADSGPAAAGTESAARGERHDRDERPRAAAGRRGRRRGCSRTSSSVPFLTRTLAPFEVLSEEGLATARGERRHGSSRRSGSSSATRRTRSSCFAARARTSRASACGSRAGLPLARPGDRAAQLHAGRAQPGERRRLRRAGHDLRAGVRLAVRPRPRRRPPLRDDRGLPQLREARLRVAVAAPLRRHRLRAGRRAGQQAPLRHGLRAHALLGQAVHGLGHAARARAATRSRWRASCSARDFLDEHTVVFSLINANSPLVWDATMLGAARAYAEANQAVMMTPFILAGAMSPSTVAATCAQTLAESLAGMAYVQLVRAGRARRARLVRVVDVDAVGRADVRHAGAGARPLRDGGARTAARRPVPLRRRPHRIEGRRRAGRVRVRQHDAADDARRASTSSSTPPAGSRAGSRWATRSSCSTPTSSGCGTRSPPASTSPRTARRWTRS